MEGLAALAPYTEHLLELLSRFSPQDLEVQQHAIRNLDGYASAQFRRLVPRDTRRAAGTFFTGSTLRQRMLTPYRHVIEAGASVVDPACGIGDLLLAAADQLPTKLAPEDRLQRVQRQISGLDLHAPLVDAAAARLALWATLAGSPTVHTSDFKVTVGDALTGQLDLTEFDLVLLNPPYAAVTTKASWATGRVTEAAPFTIDVARRTSPGTRIAAILPDVLRTGSRYEKWRSAMEEYVDIVSIDVVGVFDKWTDVDVFIAHLRRRDSSTPPNHTDSWTEDADAGVASLATLASISVGDVVPHRHTDGHTDSPFLTIDTVPVWATTMETTARIKHDGRLHQPPFVLLRRTSAPTRTGGAIRARGAVYNGTEPAAVENHLIVIRPIDGTLSTCMAIIDMLRHPSTTDWLDRRLRLRHLTVKALRELPLPAIEAGE